LLWPTLLNGGIFRRWLLKANDAKAVSESVVPCGVQCSLQAFREEYTINADNPLFPHSWSSSALSSQTMCQGSSADVSLAPLFPNPLTENDVDLAWFEQGDSDDFVKVTTLI
jgi:hypothetical protein